ncbi:thioredoxin-like protein [Endogone sp. FLAS-F59071]|nr:thioredoxin-like protein [Endogone sp. FLAS-F59071]|eukprot:RUS21605.1 thioredoxin-like protein [Endogone sp. FLAS-F59071]
MSLSFPTNLAEFEMLISGDKLVVVDFFATWCGPCKIVAPKFENLSNIYTDALFAKVDVDEILQRLTAMEGMFDTVMNNLLSSTSPNLSGSPGRGGKDGCARHADFHALQEGREDRRDRRA